MIKANQPGFVEISRKRGRIAGFGRPSVPLDPPTKLQSLSPDLSIGKSGVFTGDWL